VNIFYLSSSPVVSAQYLIDKHVNKMITESSQMLANCYPLRRLQEAPKTQKGEFRKYSHVHHPCSKWVLKSKQNFNWLLEHALAMYDEKVYRTQKGHFCLGFISWCIENPPEMSDIGFTSPAQAFKEKYHHLINLNDPISAYRNFYIVDKRFDKNGKRMDFYTKRNRPEWFPSEELKNVI
jgi:hypothetical protein